MIWILLWSGMLANGGGMASAEFNTKEACENAIQVVKSQARWVEASCVPKGEAK